MESLRKSISEKFSYEVLNEIARKKTGILNPTIKNITVGSGTKKGESYLSVVTRFTVEVGGNNSGDDVQHIHLIAKGFPANMARRETFRSKDFFKNEIMFYNKVWPALDDFQKSKNVKNPVDLIPECVASFSDGNFDFIVLEDLSYQGYSTMARNTGLDFEKSLEIVREFGRFHALSVAFNNQKPQEFSKLGDSLQETYFGLKFRNWYTPVMKKMFWVLRDAVEKELDTKYLNKLDEISKGDLFGEACKICEDRSHLCGITHGDCWAPNFLVKFDELGQMKSKFIDYQLSRCSSIVADLAFFLYVCVEPSVRDERWDDFIKVYADTIANFLKELGSNENLISPDLVIDSLKRIGVSTLVMGAEAIVMSAVEEEDVVDIDEIQEVTTVDNVWIVKLMKEGENRKGLAGFFKHLVDGHFI